MTVEFSNAPVPVVSPGIQRLLPVQGSFELQHDQGHTVHSWHLHSLDEELFVLVGEVLLFWSSDDEGYQERDCPAGTWIHLAAGTVHGSIAGASGAMYIIRPEDGRTAETTFLQPADYPYPTPATLGS